MLALALAGLLAVGADPGTRRISFEEAKKDPAQRQAWLKAFLAAHKDKGPEGLIKACLYVPEQADAAKAAIQEQYKLDGREFYFEKEYKNVLAPLDAPAQRVTVFYREGVYVASGEKAGILLVGDLFALANEDEVKSVLLDYAGVFARYFEDGVKFGDREVDTAVPAVKNICNSILLKILGQVTQLENVHNGTRKVSDAFKAEAAKQYLATYALYSREIAKQKKIYDDNNENTLQKEIYDSLDFLRSLLQQRLKKVGFDHKLVNKETHEHALEAVVEKK